jgi:hypothetical protein
VVTAKAPGSEGDEIELVALPGQVLVERATTRLDPVSLVAALEGALEPPYRALCVRRPELWVIGAVALEVIELSHDVRGDEIEVVRDANGLRVRIDGRPSGDRLPELERVGKARAESYVVRARRLTAAAFEIEVEPL